MHYRATYDRSEVMSRDNELTNGSHLISYISRKGLAIDTVAGNYNPASKGMCYMSRVLLRPMSIAHVVSNLVEGDYNVLMCNSH